MARQPTYKEVTRKVPEEVLRLQCTNAHLIEIAQDLTDWESILSFLGFRNAKKKEEEIKGKYHCLVRKQTEAMLTDWGEEIGENATYKYLIEVLMKLGKTASAENVCKIILESPPATSTNGATPATSLPTEPYAAATPPKDTASVPVQPPQNGHIPLPTQHRATNVTTPEKRRVTTDAGGSPQPPALEVLHSDFSFTPSSLPIFDASLNDSALCAAFPVKYWGLEEFRKAPLNLDGRGTSIAILDTGINSSHSAFAGKGINMVNLLPDSTTSDQHGHGTHCAGIAAGIPYSNAYVVGSPLAKGEYPGGVAPAANLEIYRVVSGNEGHDIPAILSTLDRLKKLKQAGLGGVDVVSMSFGSPSMQLCDKIEKKIAELATVGLLCVAAVGNHGATRQHSIHYPALLDNVICIGAHDLNGQPAGFTPTGGDIDFVGPGVNIYAPSHLDNAALICASGTSCATPAVAGLICLVIQRAKSLPDTMTIADKIVSEYVRKPSVMRKILKTMTRLHGGGREPDSRSGFGSLDPRAVFRKNNDEFFQFVNQL